MPPRLVTIATYASPQHAHLAKGMLEANGVHAAVLDEHVARMTGPHTSYIGGVRLQVSEADVALARDLLASVGSEALLDEDIVEDFAAGDGTAQAETLSAGDDRCPLCGAPPQPLGTRLTGWLRSLFSEQDAMQCSLCGRPREYNT